MKPIQPRRMVAAKQTLRLLTAGLARAWDRVLGNRKEEMRPRRFPHDFAGEQVRMGLDEILAQEPGRFFTTVHVLSLAGFRETAGDNWPKLAEKVLLIAESVVHRHVGADGAYGRRGEDMFLVVFSSLPAAEGRLRTHAASKELGERLLGTARFTADSLVNCVELDAETAISGGDLDLSLAAAAVAKARSAVVHETHGADHMPLPYHLKPSQAAAIQAAPAHFHLPKPATILADTVVDSHNEHKGRNHVDFVPTWVAATESLSASLCRVHRQHSADAPVLIGASAYDRPDVAFPLDRMMARTVTTLLAKPDPAAAKTVLIVPVHFAALVTRQRLMLTGIYAELPDALRLLRLEFEVFGVPDNPSTQQLLDVAAALEPLAHTAIMRLRPGQAAARLAADCGFHGVGFDVADLMAVADGTPNLHAMLETVRRQAEDAALEAHVWSLPNRHAVRAAAALGYSRLNGPALARSTASPNPPLPAARTRLLDDRG